MEAARRRPWVGIAGWSYDDWKGVVYPSGCRDTLRFCCDFVDCIEINSSFYRTPSIATTESWARRVADKAVFFTAKLPRLFTHDGELDPAEVGRVHEGFRPLVEAGLLRVLLAQFSYRFTAAKHNRQHLARIVSACRGLAPIAVEVRHRSWAEDEAMQFLRDLDVSVVHLDYPGSASGFGPRRTGALGTSSVAYFRLHGRNHDAWFRKDAGRDEVYDYEYSAGEVRGISDRIAEIASDAGTTIVIANNHFQGQAVKVALELLAVTLDSKVEVPEPLLQSFPALRRIARPGGQGSLFT